MCQARGVVRQSGLSEFISHPQLPTTSYPTRPASVLRIHELNT